MTFAVRSRLPLLLLAGAAMALALPARADDEESTDTKDEAPAKALRSVTVLPFTPVYGQVPQSLGDRTADLVREEIVKAEELKVVTAAAPKTKTPAKAEGDVEKARAEITNANALLEKGKGLLEKRKVPLALTNLDKGIKLYLENYQGTDDFKPLQSAYIALATAQILTGNDAGATKSLDDLIRLAPRFTPDKDAPGAVVEKFNNERKNILGQSRGSFVITSAPAGARVIFDGMAVGETPVEVAGVLPGEHYIRVIKDGVGGFSKKAKSNGDSQKVSATLTAEATGPAGVVAKTVGKNSVDTTTIAAVQKLGEAAEAEFVVFGAMTTNGDNIDAKAWAVRTKDGAMAELSTISVNSELLGATIEVLKLTNDLYAKVSNDTFAQAPGTITVFEGLVAPKEGDGNLTRFTVAPNVDGTVSGEPETGKPSGGRKPRGPVTAEDNKPRTPVVDGPKKPETTKVEEPTDETPLERLERQRRERKEKGTRKGPVPTETKDEETSNDVTEQTEVPGKKVDLTPPSKYSNGGATLTPEQLLELERANAKPSNAGKIALWTGVGVVGAGAIATGVYFLFFRPTAPTSATASMTW